MAEPRTRRLLRRLKLSRVDLVPRGANPEAHVTLFKSDPSDEARITPRNEPPEVVPVTDKTVEELTAELAKAETAKEEAETKLAEAETKLEATSEGELEQARTRVTELEAELEKSKDADVRKELDETREQLSSLRKEARTRTFVEKAQEFSNLGKPEILGTLLDEADEKLSADSQALLEKVLSGASEQVEKGALFAQLSDPDAVADAGWEERLEKAAEERASKSDGSLTKEQAKVQIMREDKQLAHEYAESQRS